MRQLVCLMAVAAMACLLCADSASARGRRRCSSGRGISCSSGCSTGCFTSRRSGCSTGCGTQSSTSYCAGCVASAPATSSCAECAALGMREATLVVNLPDSASLTIDGYQTKSTSGQRTFQTPPLSTGREFSYTLKAKVMRDGTPVTLTKKVTVRGGATTQITLDLPAKAVASR